MKSYLHFLRLTAAGAVLLATAGSLHAQVAAGSASPQVSAKSAAAAGRLVQAGLKDELAMELIESLTTEVGPRMAGSEADARAVQWAVAKYRGLGFDKVWTEPVTFRNWVRRAESAEILGAHRQRLFVTALGGSPGATVEAEIVRFGSLAALQEAAEGSLAGKIAFVDVTMGRYKDMTGYNEVGSVRSRGPSIASGKGAIGYLMRTVGTSYSRVANTGMTTFAEGVKPIPAAALPLPDADQLVRLLATGPVRVKLALDCGWGEEVTSHNVIAEITGSAAPHEFVLLGSHLDSWDLGTGAVDDASGVGITAAAAKLIASLPERPRRSIRVVAFANEERGLIGARQYADKHAGAVANHVLALESDAGVGRLYAFNYSSAAAGSPFLAALTEVMQPLGIEHAAGKGGPGPDIVPLAGKGGAWAWFGQDMTGYFDLHHTADDTFDKVEPAAVRQNVAAFAVLAYLAAEYEGHFGSAAK